MFVVNGKGSAIRLVAGFFVLSSAVLGLIGIEEALYFTVFVGAMLMISATTGFCPMEWILKQFKVPVKKVQ